MNDTQTIEQTFVVGDHVLYKPSRKVHELGNAHIDGIEGNVMRLLSLGHVAVKFPIGKGKYADYRVVPEQLTLIHHGAGYEAA